METLLHENFFLVITEFVMALTKCLDSSSCWMGSVEKKVSKLALSPPWSTLASDVEEKTTYLSLNLGHQLLLNLKKPCT